MKKILFSLMCLLFFSTSLFSQTTITIGTGTSTYYIPLPGWYGWNYNASLYTVDEMEGSVGFITHIGYSVASGGTATGNKAMKIYLMTTPSDVITSTLLPNWNGIAPQATLVYEATLEELNFTTGWNTFELEEPFFYDGSENLIVLTEGAGCTTSGGCSSQIHYTTSSSPRNWRYLLDSTTPPTGNESGTISAEYRANIQITIEESGLSCPRPASLVVSDALATTAQISWTAGGEETQWLFSYKEASATTWTPELLLDVTNYSMTTLSEVTEYNVRVRALCGIGDTSNFKTTSFTTIMDPSYIPFFDTFEELSSWEILNGTQSNQWVINSGAGSFDGGTQSLYITNTPTATPPTHGYINTTTSNVYAVKYLIFEAGDHMISYDWKGHGESCCDYMQVWLAPGNATFTPGSTPSNTGWINLYGSNLNMQPEWQSVEDLEFTVTTPGAHKLVIFWHNDGSAGTQPPAAIDNIHITKISCSTPQNMQASDIEETEATISWDEMGIATQWLLSYKKQYETVWSDEIPITTDPEYVIENLIASTSYNARVRSICEVGDTSSYRVISFQTACGEITSLPWIEKFDTYSSGSTSFPPCMFRPLSTSYPYISTTNYSSPNSLYFYSQSLSGGYLSMAVTPRFAADATTLMVTFQLRKSTDPYSGSMEVGVMTDPNNASTFTVVTTVNPPTTGTWYEYEIPLNISNVTDAHYIAFRQVGTSGGYTYYMDNIVVEPIPSCPRPSSIEVSPLGISATATWNPVSTESQWLVSYKAASATEWSAEILVDEPSYTMNPLTEVTAYEIRVRALCGVGDTSNYRATTFNTILEPVGIPYTEDFEMPNPWVVLNDNQTNIWVISTSTEANDNGGEQCLYISNAPTAMPPTYSYSTGSTSNVYAAKYLLFEYAGEHTISYDWKNYGESCCDYIQVWLAPVNATVTPGSTPSTTGWIDLYGANLNLQNTWQTKEVLFTVNTPGVYKLIFFWHNDGSVGTQPPGAVDNIHIERLPCSAPTNLAVENILQFSADISWDNSPEANGWLISYKTNAATDWSVEIPLTEPNYALGTLEELTTYNVRVRALCGDSDTSNFTTISFTTITEPSPLPFTDNFENPTLWEFLTGTQTNQWVFGTAPEANDNDGTQCLYISNAPTATPPTYSYSTGSTSHVYAVKYLLFENAGEHAISYDWKNYGESCCDYIQVWLAPASAILSPGVAPSTTGWINLYGTSNLNLQTNWQSKLEIFDITTPGVYKLVFYWRNDGSVGTQPPGAVDNVQVVQLTCYAPTNLAVTDPTLNSLDVSWSSASDATQWLISHKKSTETTWSNETLVTPDPEFTINGLDASSFYNIRVREICEVGDTSFYSYTNGQTSCGIITSFPWSEGFEEMWLLDPNSAGDKEAPPCWTVVDKGGTYSTYQYWWKRSTTTHTGSGAAQCYTDYGTTDHNDWLISPEIAMTGDLSLRFWAQRNSSTTSEPDEISVFISDEDITLTTVGMDTYDDMPGFELIFNQLLPVGPWAEYEVPLTGYSGNRYIAFVRQGTPNGYYLRLDDVEIYRACATVTNLNATPDGNDITLTWTAPAGNPTGYEIYYNGDLLTTVTGTSYIHASVPDGLHTYTINAIFENDDCTPMGVSTEVVIGDVCPLVIDMSDSYGDGWNGNARVDVYQNDAVIATFRLASGSSETATIIVYGGDVDFVWVPGSFNSESSFTISYDGELLYESGQLPSTGGSLFTWICGTPCERVTNLSAVPTGNDVILTWTAPSGNPSEYEIYFNGNLLTTVGGTSYTHASVPNGLHTYVVKALFADIDCVPMGESTEVTVGNVCPVIINMFDSFGDGWNGNRIDVYQNGNVIATATITSGSTATETVLVFGGEAEFVFVAGSFVSEVSFNIQYDGEELYASAGTPVDGTFLTWECGEACPSVTNISVITQGSTAIITWEAPIEGTPISYRIYFDNVEVEEIPFGTNEYTMTWLENGSHTIAIAAVYPIEYDCVPQKIPFDFTVSSCPSPSDLRAIYVTGTCNARLSWLAPGDKAPDTYNIYRDGVLIASDIEEVEYLDTELIPTEPHTWDVEYNCPNEGTSDKITTSLPRCTDAVESYYFNDLTISPNPATTFVTITGVVLSKIEIYNAMGQLISSQIDNVNTVDVSSFSSGVYLFKLYNADNESAVRRVVIAK